MQPWETSAAPGLPTAAVGQATMPERRCQVFLRAKGIEADGSDQDKQIVSLGYREAGEVTLLPFPAFPALQKYTDSVKDLAAKIDAFDLTKSAATMQQKGYTKNNDGLWTKDGKTIPMVISCPGNLFQDVAPIVTQQLRKGGFDASFKLIQGPEYADNLNTGNIDAFMQGHGGSVRDPFDTLNLYHSRYSKPTGQRATYPYRWVNPDYDKIVDQMSKVAPDDPQTTTLFRQAMEIWIPASRSARSR